MEKEKYTLDWINWAFAKYSNGKQTIGRHEMKLAVISLTGKMPLLPKNQSAYTIHDLHDIMNTICKESILNNINKIYDAIDKEGKGYVTIQDVLAASKENNVTIPVSTIESAFNLGDQDHDGFIPTKEFLDLVRSGMAELGVI